MPSNYKPFVEILPEKADSWRNYCICIAYRDVNGHPNTLLKKFPYKTEQVKNHLKKCLNFKNKNPEMFDEFFGLGTARMDDEFDENVNSNKRVHSSVPNFQIGSGSDQPKIRNRPDLIRI
jgi:hypothetical protein